MAEKTSSPREHGQPPHPSPTGLNGASGSSSPPADRQRLLDRAAAIDQLGREAAERGELATAARRILEMLDCERRAGGLGPQVLQLIKPRT
jgi:hypothetical protein